MQKKQILVLSLLATGIAIELILMVGFLAGRGNSEQALSTNSTSIAWGENNNNPSGQTGDIIVPPQEGAPVLDEDMLGAGSETGMEATPIFSLTEESGGADGSSWTGDLSGGGTSSFGGAYPAPENFGYTEGGSYPAPPTQPAGPQETFPTDVPAATEAPTSAPTQAIQPTNPPTAQPTHTPAAAATPTTAPAQPTAAPTWAPAPGGLVSVRAAAPAIDGAGSDPAWASAPAVEISVNGGANHGPTRINARSVYEGDSVFFLFTWEDPTQSFLRSPWEKQPDGSWKQLESPNSGFNDENVYYEDKLALLWPVRGMNDFSNAGCGGACHTGENADVKPYGNMYTPGDNSLADLWQWKSVRSGSPEAGAGQVDDQYLDSTRYSAESPSAGFHPDPNSGGGFYNNINQDKTAPAFMPPNGGLKNGAPGFITDAEKTEFDPRLFQNGERVPSIITAPWQGDRGDIQAAWQYKDGRWTLELRRKLVTGSPYDVQFDDLSKVYSFGIAAFDNAQVRHAYQSGATSLTFQR